MKIAIPGAGIPLNRLLTTRTFDFIANVLEDIEGENCEIEKPLDANGRGWKITLPPYANTPASPVRPLMPFDICRTKTGWRVWLRDAAVFVDNVPATPLIYPGRWREMMGDDGFSVRAWPPGTGLSVFIVQNGALFYWLVDSAYTGEFRTVAEIPIGYCNYGAQKFRGNLIYYTASDSEPIRMNPATNRYEIRDFNGDSSNVGNPFAWEGHDSARVDIVIQEPGGAVNYIQIEKVRKNTIDTIYTWFQEEIENTGEDQPGPSAFDAWYEFLKQVMEERWGFTWQPSQDAGGYWLGITRLRTDPPPIKIVHEWIECDDHFLASRGLITKEDLRAWNDRIDAAETRIDNAGVAVPGAVAEANGAADAAFTAAHRAEEPMNAASGAEQIAGEAANGFNLVNGEIGGFESTLDDLEARLTALEGRSR